MTSDSHGNERPHDHELKDAFDEIIDLSLEQAKIKATEMQIPTQGKSKNKLIQCIISKTFNIKEMQILAEASGVKRPGVNWGVDGTPPKTKQDIMRALICKSLALAFRSDSEDLSENELDQEINELPTHAKKTIEEMKLDFTLPDLMQLIASAQMDHSAMRVFSRAGGHQEAWCRMGETGHTRKNKEFYTSNDDCLLGRTDESKGGGGRGGRSFHD
eukprot:gnl/MRDRNA2_/MRDRNA2_67491_c0_seq1.p1 gnl/MRDRNA2_/MRDRNA2_67491_c0~~gnl/MRDRNA2_/MRDRNA2_67491_c0_seq1.p1  ORF type:complete len:216 (+),score=46.21 gnl/MRDRNA2_/MRDRNA2_67491_c0_seq1:160-807(+)